MTVPERLAALNALRDGPERQTAPVAFNLALVKAGNSMAARMEMIAMTTKPAPLKVCVPTVIVTPVVEPSTSATIVTGIPIIEASRAAVTSPSKVCTLPCFDAELILKCELNSG